MLPRLHANTPTGVLVWNRDNIVDIVTAYGMDDRWFKSRQQENFLFSETFRPPLGLTRSVPCAPESFPEGDSVRA